jgi:hypothetical protein
MGKEPMKVKVPWAHKSPKGVQVLLRLSPLSLFSISEDWAGDNL